MQSLLDSVRADSSSLGAHYERALTTTLAHLFQRKLLVMAGIAIALAIGIIAAFAMPKRYTAEAYIRGGFSAPNAVAAPNAAGREGSSGGLIAFDAMLVLETRSRVFQSLQLARQVVRDLGLERLSSIASQSKFSSWLQTPIYGNALIKAPEYREDMAATKLLHGLSVKTEPRVYLITLSYTSGDPELSALITNTFIAEFLRTTALETLSERRASARANLSQQLATFGDKHPNVAEARVRLAAADSLLKAELSKNAEEILRNADENIALAQANAVPSGPKPLLVIGIAFFVGLLASIGLAIWLGPRAQIGHSAASPLTGRGSTRLETQVP